MAGLVIFAIVAYLALGAWTLHVRDVVYVKPIETRAAFFIFWFWPVAMLLIGPKYIAEKVEHRVRPPYWD